MTSTIQALDQSTAARHGFCPVSNYLFAQNQPALPIQISEIGALVSTLPLAFAKLPDGMFVLMAITGFQNGRNLLVDAQGRWGGKYLPNHMRAYPFSLQAVSAATETSQQFQLAFDHASGLYREQPDLSAGEIPFFDEDGKQQDGLKQIIQFLADIAAKQNITQNAVNALAAANLFKPWAPAITLPGSEDATPVTIPQGLYCIDEKALGNLSDEHALKLYRTHAFALAYAQLFSISRIEVLRSLAQNRALKPTPPPPVDIQDISKYLGDAGGENLRFDWMSS
jgi:hypothetical protein